jgi:hypothetical protein
VLALLWGADAPTFINFDEIFSDWKLLFTLLVAAWRFARRMLPSK